MTLASNRNLRCSVNNSGVLPPWAMEMDSRMEWLSTSQVAKIYNRHVRTIQLWCERGLIMDIAERTWKDPRGLWWIKLKEDAK